MQRSDPPQPEQASTGVRHRTVRSFVLRAGRITDAQERALRDLWPAYGIDFAPATLDLNAAFGRRAPRVLEIGFGNGDNLIALAGAHP
ncbi:MAG TPA: tRNA (guanosine(46)-N7)-methyltransferase TrmB, partial [Steroidobacteraceae bacterium]|nr:tRNA (guanosine(46)-N7)-methyltransferase TrmB [Steroidobacteraceae bacterium]